MAVVQGAVWSQLKEEKYCTAMELLIFLVPLKWKKKIFHVESRGLEENKYRENIFRLSFCQNEMLVNDFERGGL